MTGVDPGYLNAGLMKPPKGFTLVLGKEKLGDRNPPFNHVDTFCERFIMVLSLTGFAKTQGIYGPFQD
jgi:hypothetical protein